MTSRPHGRRRLAACALLIVGCAAPAIAAQEGAARPVPAVEEPPAAGRTVDRLPCLGDPGQTYALYLPSAYAPTRRWPVLFLMDPRGRALVPLNLFREASERHGYILVSSWNTLSDGPWEANEKAMNAMLPDVQRRFTVDTHRVYLAGFSGTARAAWTFGYRLAGHVAGVIGFGGGLPGGFDPKRDVPFAFFGGAGNTDFNYEEMRALDARLDRIAAVHRIEFYEGSHAWPPASVCRRALEWMEIRAMRTSFREKDDALVEEIHARDLAAAAALEASGQPYDALLLYEGLAEDLAGLRDVQGASARAAALRASREVRRVVARMDRLAADQRGFEGRLYSFLQRCRAGDLPSPDRALADLRIGQLKRRASASDDPLDAQAAQRLLELAFTNLSFYEARDYLEKGDFARARGMSAIAGGIKPRHPQVCLNLARAHAQIGDTAEALDALACVVEARVLDPAFFEDDPLLDPLKKEPRYREILAGARAPAQEAAP